MKVKLKTRWGSHLPHAIVSVSKERAEFLEDKGIGKIVDSDKLEKSPKQTPKSEPEKNGKSEKAEESMKDDRANKDK